MTEHRPTVTEVVSKLQTYGSADQLAAFFEGQGVVGERDESFSCPIARYVAAQTGTSVSASQTCVYNAVGPLEDAVYLSGEDPIVDFINAFDSGGYPALEQSRRAFP